MEIPLAERLLRGVNLRIGTVSILSSAVLNQPILGYNISNFCQRALL
jgi:hypothetical protein